MNFIEHLKHPWPWYVAGPLIGSAVPLLLLMGNKRLGVSSSLRHICAACFPARIPFFKYEWKKEIWNLFFVSGIFVGGILAATFLKDTAPIRLDPRLLSSMRQYGIRDIRSLMPDDLFSWQALLSAKGLLLIVCGGFLVGFGTRYAGGCTSGHAIMGLSALQWPSLIATCCFMAGGLVTANFLIPFILKL